MATKGKKSPQEAKTGSEAGVGYKLGQERLGQEDIKGGPKTNESGSMDFIRLIAHRERGRGPPERERMEEKLPPCPRTSS